MNTWAKRIRELQDAGMTLTKIGAAIGLAPSSVGDIANGYTKSPRGEAAIKLDKLHRRKCPPNRAAVGAT